MSSRYRTTYPIRSSSSTPWDRVSREKGLPGATTAMVSPGRRAGGFRDDFRENYYTVQTRLRANNAGSRRKSRVARSTPLESFLGSSTAENAPSREFAAITSGLRNLSPTNQ